MRGAGNTVNTVRGESVLSCNTFVRCEFYLFLTGFSQAKAKTLGPSLDAKNG